jgi:hypothetical protein
VTSPLAEFDAAIADITQRRGDVYGHPADHFARIAQIKAGVADCQNPLIKHALEMIAVKMARLVASPDHVDSLIDIAGYARCAAMILDRQNNCEAK